MLAAAFLCLAVVTSSQPAAPILAEARQELQRTSNDEHGSARGNENSAQHPSTPPNQAATATSKNDGAKTVTEVHAQPTSDWWTVVLTGVIAFMATVQALTMIWQGKHMRDQVAIMRLQVAQESRTKDDETPVKKAGAPERLRLGERIRESVAGKALIRLADRPAYKIFSIALPVCLIAYEIAWRFPTHPRVALALIAFFIVALSTNLFMLVFEIVIDKVAHIIERSIEIQARALGIDLAVTGTKER